MRKNISKILIAILLLTTVLSSNVPRAQAYSGFQSLATKCLQNQVVGNLLARAGGAIGDAVNSGINWVAKKLHLPGGGGGGTGTDNSVPVGDKEVRKTTQKIDATEMIKGCAQATLDDYLHQQAYDYVTNLVQQNSISNYLNYGNYIANTIYVNDMLRNRSAEDVFLARQNIDRIVGGTKNNVDLSAIYKQRSFNAVKGALTNVSASAAQQADLVLADPLVATPQGQRFMSETAAQTMWGQAQQAAAQNLQNSQGQQERLICSKPDANGVPQCKIKYPADYVNSTINSKISSLFSEQLKPQDKIDVIKTFLDALFGKIKITPTTAPSTVLDNKLQSGTVIWDGTGFKQVH